MKLNSKAARLALIAAVTAGVCFPLLSQLKNNPATAQTPPPPAVPPKGAVISGFPQVAPDTVVLTVGDQTVTAAEVAGVFSSLDPQTQERVLSQPNGKRDLAEHFIKLKLMAAEAKREKLDQTTIFKTEYEQLLGKALVLQISQDATGNRTFFDQNKDWFSGLKARHILISFIGSRLESAKLTEPQAKAKAEEIRKRIVAGEDFVAIARTESDDRGSAATGGDLGLMKRYQMVPAFEEAAYALKDKELSQPIKTPFGYHIIQVMGRTPANYEDVAQQVVPRRRLDALIEDLKKTQKTVINDSFFADSPKPGDPATQPAK